MSNETPVITFRAEKAFGQAIDDAARKQELPRSAFIREVLGTVVMGGVTLDELRVLMEKRGRVEVSPHPQGSVVIRHVVRKAEILDGQCKHPTPALRRHAFTIVCDICGHVVKRL
jgi:hypothetical protein